jgi:FkbM family methyltransferase
MNGFKVAVSKQIKRLPPLFDAVRRATRLLGDRTPIYDLLAKASATLPDVGFIQIGSNDGIGMDPLREFIVASPKWHGALIEPVPQIFVQLRQNYSYLRREKLAFFNVAISEQPGTKQLWKIKDACLHEFPLFASQIGSFDRTHIIKHFPTFRNLDSKLEAIEVPCKTYAEIREQAGLRDVQVLHLDVEGHEYHILRSIDFTHSKPVIILFETSHIAGSTKHEMFSMLQSHGYRVQEFAVDSVAILPGYDW